MVVVPAAYSAALALVARFVFFAENVISSAYSKLAPDNEALSEFFSCAVINGLRRRPRDVHLRGALLLRQAFKVDESNRFKFVERHNRGVVRRGAHAYWREAIAAGHGAHAPPFAWTRHLPTPLSGEAYLNLWHMPFTNRSIARLLAYVNNPPPIML